MGFEAAEFAAGHKSKDFREAGDLHGAEVWAKITAKIGELKRIGYQPGATKH